MKNLILFGPPGCGKGTQSERLVKELGYIHVSTGELFRAAIAEGSEFGKQVDSIIKGGNLVSDEITLALVKERLNSFKKQGTFFILDGFPRTVVQAKGLEILVEKLELSQPQVINFDISYDVIMKRLESRGRKDDEPQVIQKRLQVYENQTAAVLDHYKNLDASRVFFLQAESTEDEVFQQIKEKLI